VICAKIHLVLCFLSETPKAVIGDCSEISELHHGDNARNLDHGIVAYVVLTSEGEIAQNVE
jgi:hypothetical protein